MKKILDGGARWMTGGTRRMAGIPRRLLRVLWRRRRPLGFALALLLTLALAVLYWPINREACLLVHPSGEMTDKNGRLLYAFMNGAQQWCFERDLAEISPRLVQATLAAEDGRFYHHPGVDPLAALRAVTQNLLHRRVVSGASTLTMQVIKQTRGPAGSLWGKACQAVLALQIERRASKGEILKAYFNTAPYGLNMVGCEAAARRYFGKPSAELTLAEAALLAALPKAPTSLMPLNHPAAARKRRDWVLARMFEEKMIGEADYRKALKEPLRAGWHAYPQLAPHLAMRLRSTIVSRGRVATSLDAAVQEKAEDLLRQHLANYTGEVGNAGMIVIDAATATVLAHVGSGNFSDDQNGGQVDVTRAARSPGSALKPFTYALAMEHNQLFACETLLDETADYGLYNPENMDRQYHGLVTADDALRRSLNVPAITVLDRIGIGSLYGFLKGLDLRTLRRPAEVYGLGLTLGSCEVRLEELATAYGMLANLGQWQPLGWAWPPDRRPARQALSKGTCLKLFEMLEQALPRELQDEAAAGALSLTPRVCWKTGTSWGHRDAWAFVFNRQYVVGVWAGNNDARPSPYLMGARTALPLAGRMFRALKPTDGPAWPNPEEELHEVKVCALSGLPASDWCRQTRTVWLPRGQFLSRVCDMHYPQEAALAAAPAAAPVLERWPGSARGWDLARITRVLPYAPSRLGAGARRGDGLAIKIPTDKAQYIMTGAPDGDKIRLSASLDEQTKLYWYLDQKFIGTAEPWRPLLVDLTPGQHVAVCMTPEGLTDQARYEVLESEAALDGGRRLEEGLRDGGER